MNLLDEANEEDLFSKKEIGRIMAITKKSNFFPMLAENEYANDTLMYFVEFTDNQGFALLSADYRCQPIVLVITEKGGFDDFFYTQIKSTEMNNHIDSISDFWVANSEHIFDPTPNYNGTNSMLPSFVDKWYENSILLDIYGNRVPNPLHKDPDSVILSKTELVDRVKPMIKTLWHQTSPFNDNCDECTSNVNGNGGHKYVGCTGVAVSQIVAYHEYPKTIDGITFNYQNMKRVCNKDADIASQATQADKEEVAHFVKKMANYCNTNYGCDGSWSTLTFAKYCFKNKLNYQRTEKYTKGAHDRIVYGWNDGYKEKTVNSLKKRNPVLVTGGSKTLGGGHAWVCDGYANYKKTYTCYYGDEVIEESNFIVGDYLHFNWGWKYGTCNGYYFGNIFNSSDPIVLDDGSVVADNGRYYWGFGLVLPDKY